MSEFPVGVEEELHLVDAETHELAPIAADVLARIGLPDGRAAHEAYAAQIELRSPPCADAGEVHAALAENRAAARAAGATLLGAGLHPTDTWGAPRRKASVARCAQARSSSTRRALRTGSR